MKNKAQSIIEYAVLFMILVAAITLTHRYLYGAMNARLKHVQEGLTYTK